MDRKWVIAAIVAAGAISTGLKASEEISGESKLTHKENPAGDGETSTPSGNQSEKNEAANIAKDKVRAANKKGQNRKKKPARDKEQTRKENPAGDGETQ